MTPDRSIEEEIERERALFCQVMHVSPEFYETLFVWQRQVWWKTWEERHSKK